MTRLFPLGYLVAGSLLLLPPAFGDTFTYIFTGKVLMEDGSPPPKAVGIERLCSDNNGSAPGPFTNKKGEFTWRMEINTDSTRACVVQAILQGYASTQVEIHVNTHTANLSAMALPDIMLISKNQDPKVLVISYDGVPTKATRFWREGMQSLDKNDFASAAMQLEEAMATSPKFARGWHTLGLVYINLQKFDQARADFQKSVDADPKYLPGQVMLDRFCVRDQDWGCVTKASDEVNKLDAKKAFESEMLTHQAVVKFAMKDISGAESLIQQSISSDKGHKNPRAEYVLGRILEAKGDLNGAKEHMNKYLEMAPDTPDADRIRAHLQIMGKPGSDAAQQTALEIF